MYLRKHLFHAPVPDLQDRNAAPIPVDNSATTETLAVILKKSWFSDCHGKVTKFAVIVAEDPSYNSSGVNLLKWSQVRKTSKSVLGILLELNQVCQTHITRGPNELFRNICNLHFIYLKY